MAQPIYSPDGRFWWDGQRWLPVRPVPVLAIPKLGRSSNRPILVAVGLIVLLVIVLGFVVSRSNAEQAATNGGYQVDGDAPLQNVDARVRATGASWLTHITGVEQGSSFDFNDIYVTTDMLEDGVGEKAIALAICHAYANASAADTRIVIQGYRIETQDQIDGSTSSEQKRAGLARQISGESCVEI